MDYIIYALAAIGVHNLWFYQQIMVRPKALVEKYTRWIPVFGKGIGCDQCVALWIIVGMMYAGPYIPKGLLYSLAVYPIFLFYLSFNRAFKALTKKFELHLDRVRPAVQSAPNKTPPSGNRYEVGEGGSIVRAPTPSIGERVVDSGCTDCEQAKAARLEAEGK